MSDFFKSKFNRRGVIKSTMAMMAGGLMSRYELEKAAAQTEPAVKNVNLNSSPSTLKITDMRHAIIARCRRISIRDGAEESPRRRKPVED
jgi:hypothetical protein